MGAANDKFEYPALCISFPNFSVSGASGSFFKTYNFDLHIYTSVEKDDNTAEDDALALTERLLFDVVLLMEKHLKGFDADTLREAAYVAQLGADNKWGYTLPVMIRSAAKNCPSVEVILDCLD